VLDPRAAWSFDLSVLHYTRLRGLTWPGRIWAVKYMHVIGGLRLITVV
jgi:hypothetical protein